MLICGFKNNPAYSAVTRIVRHFEAFILHFGEIGIKFYKNIFLSMWEVVLQSSVIGCTDCSARHFRAMCVWYGVLKKHFTTFKLFWNRIKSKFYHIYYWFSLSSTDCLGIRRQHAEIIAQCRSKRQFFIFEQPQSMSHHWIKVEILFWRKSISFGENNFSIGEFVGERIFGPSVNPGTKIIAREDKKQIVR